MWFVALSVSSAVMGLTLLAPALPLIQQGMSASNAAVQQLLTVYLIALAVGQLVYGTLSDRFGRRPVLLFGALLFGLSGIAALFVSSIEALTVIRGVQGLGGAACLAMGRAIVNDCFERSEAAKNMSVVASMIAVVPILSLLFGGLLSNVSGWQGIMAVTAASGFLVFAITYCRVTETNLNRLASINIGAVLSAYRETIKNRLFFWFSMAGGMQVGMFFAMNGLLPFQYQRLGYSAAEFGLWFSLTPASYLIGNYVNRQYFVSRGIERAALIGCCLSLIAVILMFFTQALHFTHALSLALPCCLFGFANGIVVSNSTIGAIAAVGKNAGTGTGIAGAWQMASGGIAGAIIVGLGGAQNFNIATAGLIVMSLISVVSMVFVCRDCGQTD